MSDWIKNLKDDKERKAEEAYREANEVRELQCLASYLVRYLISFLKTTTGELNKVLHGGTKVYDVSDNVGFFNSFEEDFVVMTQIFPAAYLFIDLVPQKRILTRKLRIVEHPEAKMIEKVLPELQIGLDAAGKLIVREKGRVLNTDDMTRLFVEPVYRAHTKC
ncbi:MAG: hypothetical protein ACR2G4_01620 [Pyrinomonadaceae bacterium]